MDKKKCLVTVYRWAREFSYSLNMQALKEAKLKAKDQRKEIVEAASNTVNSNASSGGEKKGEEEEESDWKRTLVMWLRERAISFGLIADNNYKDEER